jgi:hypothetical protein
MLTESIQQKIQELFDSTPDNVGVSYGKKRTNGQFTGEIGIVFSVETKLPLDQVPEDQVLPSSITIDGVDYITDVVQVGKVKTLACDSTTLNNCYTWQTVPVNNRLTCRPLKGGVSMLSFNNQAYLGTFGFIAVDVETQAFVGVSNNHVLIPDNFYTSSRNLNGVIQNELSDNVYQTGDVYPPDPDLKIGQVVRYVPLLTIGNNRVDGALFSIDENPTYIFNSESIKQFGLSYNLPMAFATTAEINNLLATNPPVYSSGRTTGAKGEGLCGLTISQVGAASTVLGFHLQGAERSAYFVDTIGFTRSNPDCPYPITGGDSGSALIASFAGVWKIIGLVFATGEFEGFACRIDEVASQLGIEAWDGTTKNYIDPSTIVYKTVPGGSNNKTLSCGGSTYWQVGLTNASSPC